MPTSMVTAETVQVRLEGHEELCGERAKVIGKRFDDIDKRFDDIDKRFEQQSRRFDQQATMTLTAAGAIISAMAFVIWELFKISTHLTGTW